MMVKSNPEPDFFNNRDYEKNKFNFSDSVYAVCMYK